MTRIIAGSARGRRLKVPATSTRPTSDRVREAIFASLEAAGLVRGADVLDLFAGSGALGLEAVSRGARSAVLVDQAAPAIKTVLHNIDVVGVADVRAVRHTAAGFLRTEPSPFDLVFLDPPYDHASPTVDTVLRALTGGWLAEAARVIVERGRGGTDLRWPPGLQPEWERRFGDTHVLRAVWYGHEQNPR